MGMFSMINAYLMITFYLVTPNLQLRQRCGATKLKMEYWVTMLPKRGKTDVQPEETAARIIFIAIYITLFV